MTVKFTIEADGKKAEAALKQVAKAMGDTSKKTTKAGKSAKTANTRFKNLASKGLKAAKVAAIAMGAAFVAAAVGGVKLLKVILKISDETAKLVDHIAKTSRAYGVATEEMQGWVSAAGMAGVEQKTAERAFLNVSKSAVEAGRGLKTYTDLFNDLGVKVKTNEGALKTNSQLIKEISTNLQKGLIPAAKEAAVVSQLFRDRTGRVLLALKQGPEAVDAAIERLERYGALMGTELLKVSEEYVDSQQRLKEAFLGVKLAVAEGSLPALVALNNTTAEWIGTNEKGRSVLTDIISRIFPSMVIGAVRIGEAFAKGSIIAVKAIGKIDTLIRTTNRGWLLAVENSLQVIGDVAARLGSEKIAGQVADALQSVTDRGKAMDRMLISNKRALQALEAQAVATGVSADQFIDDYLKNMIRAKTATDRATNGLGGLGDALDDVAKKADELPDWMKKVMAGEAVSALPGFTFQKQGDLWDTTSIVRFKDATEDAADTTAAAIQKMTGEYQQLGAQIGSAAGNIATAKDKTEALKQAGISMAQTLITKIAEAAAASVAASGAQTAAGVASGAAITAAQTPAAITATIATEGGAAAGGAAAFAGAIAAMAAAATALLGGIGEKGIPGTQGGTGRSVVMRQRGEMLMDNKGTTKFHGLMDSMQGLLDRRGGGGGGLLRGMAMGGGGGMARVNVRTVVQVDRQTLVEQVDEGLAHLMNNGASQVREALEVN